MGVSTVLHLKFKLILGVTTANFWISFNTGTKQTVLAK